LTLRGEAGVIFAYRWLAEVHHAEMNPATADPDRFRERRPSRPHAQGRSRQIMQGTWPWRRRPHDHQPWPGRMAARRQHAAALSRAGPGAGHAARPPLRRRRIPVPSPGL